jgi:hypothetical protein
MREIKRFVPQQKSNNKKVEWKYLKGDKSLCLIKKLLAGEKIHQTMNNCNHTRISNVVFTLRKLIGYEKIENVIYDEVTGHYYDLVREPRVIQKLEDIIKVLEAGLSGLSNGK